MEPKPKTRLELQLTPEAREKLERLQKQSGSSTLVETVRRAIALYDTALFILGTGGQVVFRHKDGKEEVSRFL